MFSQTPVDEIRQIFLSLPVAVCLLDRDLRYVAANEKFASLMDASLTVLKGKLMADFCAPELVAKARRDFAALNRGQPISDHEVSVNGRTYLVSVGPLYQTASDQMTAVSVALADVSDLKQVEAVLATSNAKLSAAYEQIRMLAETDPLTGLLNRYGLQRVMEQEVRRCRRNGHPLSLAVVDVDWFKLYNDLYGHVAGDAALQAVSAAIRAAIRRPGDWAARYGGEEFVVILPNTPVAGAAHVGEAIKRAVHDLAIGHGGSLFSRITVSVGIAGIQAVPRRGDSSMVYEALLRDADSALYAVKGNGRNGLQVFGSNDRN